MTNVKQEIAGIELPPPKPYLNKKQRYPVGNGIMMAVGDGAWLRSEV
jgi:hypothetical protein